MNEKNVKLGKSNTQFYTVSVRTFVIPFYYGSGIVINYSSGSATGKKLLFLRFRFRDTAVTPLENREFWKINLRMNGGLLEIVLLE